MPRNNNANIDADASLPSRRSWRRALQALLVALALVDALFFALLLKPAGERARLERDAFEQLRSELQARRDSLAGLRLVTANTSAARSEDVSFYQQRFLPASAGFSIIMEEVDKLAQANKVRKGSVTYALGDVRGQPELNQVDISTMIEGEYANMVRFVNSVERSPLFLIIDNVSVGGGALIPGQPRGVRLSLRLVTFFKV